MKVLVLVTLSYDQPIYSAHRDVWREFMHAYPDVTTYFIASRDGLQSVVEDGDILWTPGPEGYPNGVPSGARLEKTLDALEWAEGRKFDFIVRTGLSSLWIYTNLLKFLSSLPRTGVYCGIDGGGFISGAGTILSADVASLLVKNRELAVSFPHEEDVRMGACLESLGIPRLPATRVDVVSPYHYQFLSIPHTAYHFRVKFHNHNQDIRKHEVAVMRDILQRFNIFFQP